jgi:hypothetical protein
MYIDPQDLIRETVAHLETLAGMLKDNPDPSPSEKSGLTPEARTRKEVGLSIKVLLPKLRGINIGDDAAELPRHRGCETCDD